MRQYRTERTPRNHRFSHPMLRKSQRRYPFLSHRVPKVEPREVYRGWSAVFLFVSLCEKKPIKTRPSYIHFRRKIGLVLIKWISYSSRQNCPLPASAGSADEVLSPASLSPPLGSGVRPDKGCSAASRTPSSRR